MNPDIIRASRLIPVALFAACAAPRAPVPAPDPIAQAPKEAPPLEALPPPAPAPIYRNPTIAVIHLRAHEDAEGRLFGPQVMYQVAEPGGWNIEALDRGTGYLPAGSAEPPPADSPPAGSPLADPEKAARIAITGLMRPEDRAEAEALAKKAGGGRTAVYDDEAGWLIMPASAPLPEAPAADEAAAGDRGP